MMYYLNRIHTQRGSRRPQMKILLVEDNARHARTAKAVLTAAGFDFIHASDMDGAKTVLDRFKENGITHVITDLFMPQGGVGYSNSRNEPCGVAVMLCAQGRDLPAVICTDGCHHGARYDWVTQLGRSLGWIDMADFRQARTREAVAPEKDWTFALELLGLVEADYSRA